MAKVQGAQGIDWLIFGHVALQSAQCHGDHYSLRVEGGYPEWVEMETLLVLRLGVHIMFMIESSVDSFFDLLIFNGMDASVIYSLFAVMFRLALSDTSTIAQRE